MEYEEGIPTEPDYWQNIKKGAVFVFDDLWAEAADSLQVSKAFKIWSKKHSFSIIIVTQVQFILKKYKLINLSRATLNLESTPGQFETT